MCSKTKMHYFLSMRFYFISEYQKFRKTLSKLQKLLGKPERCCYLCTNQIDLYRGVDELPIDSEKKTKIKRGDIYYVQLSPVMGSEQGGLRPAVIVQNDIGNKYSPTVIVVPITSKMSKAKLPTHVQIHKDSQNGLETDSVILTEQIRTIDKQRLKEHIGVISKETLEKIDNALKISLHIME